MLRIIFLNTTRAWWRIAHILGAHNDPQTRQFAIDELNFFKFLFALGGRGSLRPTTHVRGRGLEPTGHLFLYQCVVLYPLGVVGLRPREASESVGPVRIFEGTKQRPDCF